MCRKHLLTRARARERERERERERQTDRQTDSYRIERLQNTVISGKRERERFVYKSVISGNGKYSQSYVIAVAVSC